MSAAMTPVQAADAFAAGNAEALKHIPLTATDGRASLGDMDGLPLVPSAAWSTYSCAVWMNAGLLETDIPSLRFRLTEIGRRVLRTQTGASA